MGAALPVTDSSLPLGHRGHRGSVLVQLKQARRLGAKDLAQRVGISVNAMRHHLRELEGEGLVGYEREHRGVGAPVFLYHLTAAGENLFPRRYEEALTTLLDHIVDREGREAALTLLEAHVAGQKNYKTNKHELDESLKRQIRERWGMYFERYGYE